MSNIGKKEKRKVLNARNWWNPANLHDSGMKGIEVQLNLLHQQVQQEFQIQ